VTANITITTTSMITPSLPLYRSSEGHVASASRAEVTSAVGQLRCTATVKAAT
jgi:hypothetical protein